MSPSRDPRRPSPAGALLTVLLAVVTAVTATAPGAAAEPAPPEAARGTVEDLVLAVESLDQTVSEFRRGTEFRVALVNDLLFDFDRAEVKRAARQRLAEVAGKIRENGADGTIHVDGHTDDRGGDGYNRSLSHRRAVAVKDELARMLSGVNVTFQTRDYGEARPVAPNSSDQNRACNRRVEITFQVRR